MNYVKIINEALVTKVGDLSTEFKFQLLDSYRSPVDLTGKTVTMQIATSDTLILQRVLTPADATNGLVSFSFESGDALGIGQRDIEFVVSNGVDDVEVFPSDGYVRMTIQPNLLDRDGDEQVLISLLDAQEQALDAAESAKTNWLTPVADHTAIESIANPTLGDTVQSLDNGYVYRYDGSSWVYTQGYSSTALADVNTQLADTANNINSQLIKKLNENQITKIKLIGDSITAGVGDIGYYSGSTREIVFRNGSMVYETGTDWDVFPSWANLFRKFITNKYPTIDFFNAGVGGISTKEVVDTFLTDLVDENEDVVFVMLGTNDRSLTTLEEYEMNISYLLDYINQRSNLMIVMSATPSLSDFSDETYTDYAVGRQFGAREIDNVVTEVCSKNNYIHISNYRGLLDYASKRNVKISELLEETGSHPKRRGHAVVWQNIQQRLGFANDVNEWFYQDVNLPEYVDSTKILPVMTPDLFPFGESYSIISSSEASSNSFPKNTGGVLKTFNSRSLSYDGYFHQTYTIYRTGEIYSRAYNESNGSWSSWITGDKFNVLSLSSMPSPSSYALGITYNYITTGNGSSMGMPESRGGLLVTIVPRLPIDGWAKQIYYLYALDRVYVRSYSGSSWGSWKRSSGNFSMTSTERGSLSTNALSAGDQIFDTTINKPLWRNSANDGWVDSMGNLV
jgi:lysophospholipase L1-like esterase